MLIRRTKGLVGSIIASSTSLLERGRRYTGRATFLAYGADIIEVPTDDDGLMVEAVPELVQKSGRIPKAICVIPNFQNPTGTAMSLNRRLLLLALAKEWGSLIIDDPYGMLRFDGAHIPGFRELCGGDPLVFPSTLFQDPRSRAARRLGGRRSFHRGETH